MFALITRVTLGPGDRVKAFAWWGVAGSIGGGVVIGGALLSTVGWQAIFLLVAAASLPIIVLSRALPPAEGDPSRSLDLPGAILAAGAMTAAVLSLVHLTGGDLVGVALLGLAGALVAALVVVERRVAAPLIPLEIVARGPIGRVGIISILQAALTNTPLYFFAIYMQDLDGHSAAATGLAFVPCNVALIVGSTLGGRLVPRIATARTAALGIGIVAAGHLAMARLPANDGYVSAFLPGTILAGLGLGVSQVAVASAMSSGVPTSYAGLASSVLNATNQLGTAVGLAFFVGVATATGGDLGDQVIAYRWVFATGAAITVASAVLAAALIRPTVEHLRAERTTGEAALGHPAR